MFRDKLAIAADNRWFSYITIILLQLKVVWGAWLFRDLTSGDTSSYFLSAVEWSKNFKVPITWSPLYTSFYGTLLFVFDDAYTVTIVHRLIIVLVLAILVLALLRQLLPSAIAWMTAAWWVILPINFDSLYEVHLFAVIPVLLAILVVLRKRGPWGRGIGLAVLLASAFLMRNEYLLATILFAASCFAWEFVHLRRGTTPTPALARTYGIPVFVACFLIALFYLRASDASAIRSLLSRKHTLNMCQVYAYGYQQRHSDWQSSPWTECQELMNRDFGASEPTLREAFGRNPEAILEHFWWNIQLIPNGIQVLLFNAMSGTVSPDYGPVIRSVAVLPLSLLVCVVVAAGVRVMYRERRDWWTFWLKDRIWGWIVIGCIACIVPAIVLTQRPRPSYLLAFGVALRTSIAMSVFVLGKRHPRYNEFHTLFPIVVILLLAVVPSYYYYVPSRSTHSLLEFYRTLTPFHEWIQQPSAGLVTSGWTSELCNYIGRSTNCRPLNYSRIRQQVTVNSPLQEVLHRSGASVFFADSIMLGDPVVRRFVADAPSYGWRVVAMRHDSQRDWDLLVKPINSLALPALRE